MLFIFWLFVGFLVGLLIVSVFFPAVRKIPSLPSPGDSEVFQTSTGCVRFKTEEAECTNETSLNFIAQSK